MHTAPRALLFDLDETLVDRRAGLVRYAHGMWETQPVEAATREGFIASFIALDRNGSTPRKDFFDQLCARHLPQADPAALLGHFIHNAWHDTPLFDDTRPVLAALRQAGYRLAIVSNGQSATQRAKILNSGLHAMVDAFVISGELGSRKPEPAIFHHVLDQLDVPPEATWHIGDCPRGRRAGRAERRPARHLARTPHALARRSRTGLVVPAQAGPHFHALNPHRDLK